MKKIVSLAILPFLTFPMASIAADRALDATINAALEMITPGYCDFASTTIPDRKQVRNWYDNAKKNIISCYEEANKNTSTLPKNNPAYEKCVIADFLVKADVDTLNQDGQKLEAKKYIYDTYSSNLIFQDRFANVTKDIHGQENNEYREYMRKTLHTASNKLKKSCF